MTTARMKLFISNHTTIVSNKLKLTWSLIQPDNCISCVKLVDPKCSSSRPSLCKFTFSVHPTCLASSNGRLPCYVLVCPVPIFLQVHNPKETSGLDDQTWQQSNTKQHPLHSHSDRFWSRATLYPVVFPNSPRFTLWSH